MVLLKGADAAARWRWPHFKPTEFADHKSGELVVDSDFMDRLEALRYEWGKALRVTSGYRTAEHNQEVSFTGACGPHTTGEAADLAMGGDEMYAFVPLVLRHGFAGVGISARHGASGTFVHLDTLAAPKFPRPRIWSY